MNENATTIKVTVIPKSSSSEIRLRGDEIRVYLNAPPVDGKANAECIKLLSRKLHIPKTSITIVRGERGRKKELRLENISPEQVRELL